MSNDDASIHSAMTVPQPGPAIAPAQTRWHKLLGTLKHFKGAIVAIAGVGAVLGGLTGYWTSYQTVRTVAAPVAESAAPVTARSLSIAVLPFANQTGDTQKAYIADALTTSITSDLSRIRDAYVTGAATAYTYKDKAATLQQIGKDLGVRFVLQGSILSSGEKLRISVQLADTQSGAQLWSETLEGELTNLFALQDHVTTRIGHSIGREMVIVAAREAETRKSTQNVADLMLRASALRLKQRSLKNLQQMAAWYRQVLVLDPENARAMVDLATTLVFEADLSSQTDASDREKKYAEARELALKAKELDPDNPGVYLAIGVYAARHDDYAGARRAAEIRFSLDPKNGSACNMLAISHMNGGEPQKALELLTRAVSFDPRHPFEALLINTARAHFMLGDNAAAIDWAQRSLDAYQLPNAYVYLAIAYALKGDDAKARAAVAELRRARPGFKLTEFYKPKSSNPAAYKEWFDKKYLPAARKAGLPE